MSRKKQSVMIRCSVDGKPTWYPATGYRVDNGPFAVTTHNGCDGLTHIQTGYLVANYLEKPYAEKLARELVKLPVDWGFDDPSAVKSFGNDMLVKIGDLRKAALNGDLP